MEHDLEKLAVTALPVSASPIMRHDFCIESWKHCEQVKSELLFLNFMRFILSMHHISRLIT